jgi:hypothetical protein
VILGLRAACAFIGIGSVFHFLAVTFSFPTEDVESVVAAGEAAAETG